MPTVTNYHLTKRAVTIFCTFALALALIQEAVAQQFTVTAISPAHGATNVPLNAVISVTFSAAIDTGFRFANNNLPINGELHPDTAFVEPDSVAFSADRRTITLHHLSLQPDTRYVLLITGARCASQTPLARPATVTFSTGSTLPSGAVSGTAGYTGGPSGAVVGIFNDSVENAAGFAVADDNGNYTVPFLPGGNYFALSIKDVNLDGEINPGNVDPIGGYDPDANKLVNAFSLPAGGNLTGVNITLRHPTPQTARGIFSPSIENIAKSVQGDAQLAALAANNLGVDGKSTFWNYLFYSATIKMNFGLAGTDVICFPFFAFSGGDESDTLEVPLPPDWIDSKVALDSAQAYLGREFLQKYPDAKINGFAGPFDLGTDEGAATRSTFRFGGRQTFLGAKPQRLLLRQNGAQPRQAWVFNYTDEASLRSALIALDVRTGKPLFVFRLTTAFPNLAVAQTAASRWAPDAQLVLVGSPPGAGFSPVDGASPAWVFVYYSAGKDSLRQFIILFGNLAGQENVLDFPKRSIPPLAGSIAIKPHPWPNRSAAPLFGKRTPIRKSKRLWDM